MGFTAGQGISTADSTKEAVAQAVSSAKVISPSIAFVSCTVARDVDEVQREFVAALPGVHIHGMTSSGALLSPQGVASGGVGCLLISTDDEFGAKDFATTYSMTGNAKEAAMALKESAIAAIENAYDGLKVHIFGGTAADDTLSGARKIITEAGTSGTGISLVGVGKEIKFGGSISGPYEKTNKTAIATKTEGRRVFEIDGKPAADWVLEWLGEEEIAQQYKEGGLILSKTAQKPICITTDASNNEHVSCHLAALGGEANKYVDFFTTIPEGSQLTIMDAGNGPETGYAAHLAAQFENAKSAGGIVNPKECHAGFLIYCGGMAIAAGENLEVGLTSVDFKGCVGNTPLLGVTCFGEQSPLEFSNKNKQMNLALGILLFE